MFHPWDRMRSGESLYQYGDIEAALLVIRRTVKTVIKLRSSITKNFQSECEFIRHVNLDRKARLSHAADTETKTSTFLVLLYGFRLKSSGKIHFMIYEVFSLI